MSPSFTLEQPQGNTGKTIFLSCPELHTLSVTDSPAYKMSQGNSTLTG